MFNKIEAITSGEFEKINLYEDIVQQQIEKMFISSEIDEKRDGTRSRFRIYPILYLYKILLELGNLTGDYGISKDEYTYFVSTEGNYKKYLDSLLLINVSRYGENIFRDFYEYKDKLDNRFNLVLEQLRTLEIENDKIILKEEYVDYAHNLIRDFEDSRLNNENYLELLSQNIGIKDFIKASKYKDNLYNNNYEYSFEGVEGYFSNVKERPIQKIYFGPPGTGKSYNVTQKIIEHQKENGIILDSENYNSDYVFRTTIYPEYSYYDFIGNIMPIVDKEGAITYDFKPGVFTLALSKALEVSELNIPVYLVIEEISRGNIASIFGDIFQLLDRDKTGVSEYKIANDIISNYLIENSIAEYKVRYDEESNKKEIYLPSNFNILGTVNTSDQNVFVMDTAFKRRFEFEYVDIAPIKDEETGEYLNEFFFRLDDFEYSWNDFYKKLNNYIVSELEFPEDKQIGQFFIKFDKGLDDENYRQIQNKLLQYLWEDIHLINITENNLFKPEYKSFSKLYHDFGKHINVFNNKFIESLSKESIDSEELEDDGEDSLENNGEV